MSGKRGTKISFMTWDYFRNRFKGHNFVTWSFICSDEIIDNDTRTWAHKTVEWNNNWATIARLHRKLTLWQKLGAYLSFDRCGKALKISQMNGGFLYALEHFTNHNSLSLIIHRDDLSAILFLRHLGLISLLWSLTNFNRRCLFSQLYY